MNKEFKPIAMKCNQEQFEAIKPKLGNYRTDYTNNFNEYPYLTNYLQHGNQVATCTEFFAKNNTERHELHKTWNEKVFLEACGIETTPTLEEVKEYFKDAIRVKSQYDLEFDIGKIFKDHKNYSALDAYNDAHSHTIWSKSKGYAKILTYKNPKVNIITPSKPIGDYVIFNGKKYVPEVVAFEPEKKELVVGRWYKTTGNDSIFFLNKKNKKSLYGYGISYEGNWKDAFEGTDDGCKYEATQQEVEEALKAEAVRRGFKEGVLFESVEPNIDGITRIRFGSLGDTKMFWNGSGLFNSRGWIFKDGQWAEIIHPKKMTKAEIETEFGYNIEIV